MVHRRAAIGQEHSQISRTTRGGQSVAETIQRGSVLLILRSGAICCGTPRAHHRQCHTGALLPGGLGGAVGDRAEGRSRDRGGGVNSSFLTSTVHGFVS